MRFAVAFVVACSQSASAPSGIDVLPDSNRPFVPAVVTVERQPAMCGVANPPYDVADQFELVVRGAFHDDQTASTIQLFVHSTLPLAQALPVDLGDLTQVGFEATQSGTLPLSGNQFVWTQSSDPNELDPTALATVTVEFDGFPAADGDDLGATIRMVFVDGGVFDVHATATATTVLQACPAG